MKRLFWLGVGVAVGVYATRRATEAAHAMTPAGIGANLADGLRELGAGLGAFGAEVRAGMDTRERELTDLVERRTGAHLPTWGEALAEEPATRRGTEARFAGAARGADVRSAGAPRGADVRSAGAPRSARARRAGA